MKGQDLWDDMGTSELVLRKEPEIIKKTVIVRPTNMAPPSEAIAFTSEWKDTGGADDELIYLWKDANDPPPGKWINRRSIAVAVLDLVEDPSRDGTALSLFQG